MEGFWIFVCFCIVIGGITATILALVPDPTEHCSKRTPRKSTNEQFEKLVYKVDHDTARTWSEYINELKKDED
jgi:hypothetical protein